MPQVGGRIVKSRLRTSLDLLVNGVPGFPDMRAETRRSDRVSAEYPFEIGIQPG